VYLTGTVRDTQPRKMSKSLGNGIDRADVVRLYGTDALRWTLIGGGSLGADVIVDPNDLETTFAPGRNFANKLWNIGRFILSQLPAGVTPIDRLDRKHLTLADRWICRARSHDPRCHRRARAVPPRRGGEALLRVRLNELATGMWKRSSRGWRVRPTAPPRRRCSRTAVTSCCGCCTPSSLSLRGAVAEAPRSPGRRAYSP